MQLYRFDRTDLFYERVRNYLLTNEAHHCLMLGIIDTLVQHPDYYEHSPYLATVEEQGQVIAVAIRTPPYRLVLSNVQDLRAIGYLANDLFSQSKHLPGVSGMTTEADTFARAWRALSAQTIRVTMQLQIHQLQAVQPVVRANGQLRPATPADRPLLCQWYSAFIQEALGGLPEDPERAIDHRLNQQALYLWQTDQQPVTMVCCERSTPNGECLSLVYTPPEYRRRGYATAGVAHLSQRLLDQGKQFCLLFTDLANPTANHIYRAIGYEAVCDWSEYSFAV